MVKTIAHIEKQWYCQKRVQMVENSRFRFF